MEIEYYKKHVYGKELWYIKDPKTAELIRRLTGAKTFGPSLIEILGEFGVKFKQVLP